MWRFPRRSACRLVAGLLALLTLAPPGFEAIAAPRSKKAPEPVYRTPDDILRVIDTWREEPQPDRLPGLVQAMARMGLLRDPDSSGVHIGFTAGVLGSTPDKADTLLAAMFPLRPEDQIIVIRGLAYSGLPDWQNRLRALAERMPARKVSIDRVLTGRAETLMTAPLADGPAVLDALWGYYFATGEPAPVDRIIAALQWARERDNLERLTLGAMAQFTLASNASRDKALLDHLKRVQPLQPAVIRAPLQDAIAAAEAFEVPRLRKQALAAIDELKRKGPESPRRLAAWGEAAQTMLALGCVGASVAGQVQLGLPCVVGGAVSSAALRYMTGAAGQR